MGVSQKLNVWSEEMDSSADTRRDKKHEPFIKAVKNNTNKRAGRGRNLN